MKKMTVSGNSPKAIQRMIDNPGCWLAADTNHPGTMVVIYSEGGILRAHNVGQELAPDRFYETLVAIGPFTDEDVINEAKA